MKTYIKLVLIAILSSLLIACICQEASVVPDENGNYDINGSCTADGSGIWGLLGDFTTSIHL